MPFPHDAAETKPEGIRVRRLEERDLPEAERIFRLAFGTFIGLADPMKFSGDAAYVRARWLAHRAGALAAELGGQLAGSNFAVNWGSVGYFGPLTVRPDLWERGIGKSLVAPAVELFERWGTRLAGLHTYAQSPKHVALYQKFGFWPRFLTAVMTKPAEPRGPAPDYSRYSAVPEKDRVSCLAACGRLTDLIYGGLDLAQEIQAVDTHHLGDTVLLREEGRLAGFAVCHCGAGTETSSGVCYVKFGAAQPGAAAERLFARLLHACEALAISNGLSRIEAGVNLARHEAYRVMLEAGFRTRIQGVAMHRHGEPGYNRPGVFLIDDWR